MTNLVSQREASTKSYKRFQDSLTLPTGLYGIDTGFHDINMATGGHVPTKITCFAGRSGFGKTALVVQMSNAASKVVSGRRAELLILSWEMGSDYLVDRSICHDLGITLSQLRYPKILTPEVRKEIPNAYARASKLPVHYHHQSSSIETCMKVMDDFLETIRIKEAREGVKIQPVMVLDFIGKIKGSSSYRGNKTYDMDYFLSTLKQYNNATGFCSFILAQLLRSVDSKDHPDLEDVKDSSSIEENSDNLILGHRPEYYGKPTVKNPRTGTEVPSQNRILLRFMKTRENRPEDKLAYCDMAHFRVWSEEHQGWDYDYHQDYSREGYWLSKL